MTLGVGSGPGAFTSGSTLIATVTNGVTTFNNLTLVTPGTYHLDAVVPGLYTGPDSASFTVLPLQVVAGSFAGTPSGFSLQLNAPILVDSVTPALYGTGAGPAATVKPTVTLTQTSGTPPPGNTLPYQVPGSLIVNQATNALTFVETDTNSLVKNGTPLLPDGMYVVHIRSSGVNGLQALNVGGGYLDGTDSGTPGHDFTATFTVGSEAAGDDVVWLPATTDGPGQLLSAPGKNQAGGGYPVYIDDHTGIVTNVEATLTYYPTLLTITPTSTATFSVTVPSAGTAILHYKGPALAAGVQTAIGYISATVPTGTTVSPMPYRAKDLLILSGVSLNGGSVATWGAETVHLVAYVGDASGDGTYSTDDAVRITRVVLQTDTGLAAYPLVDPVIVADTDGSGFIPADAALQANEAGVGVPTANLPIPPIPSGVVFQAIPNNADPAISIPADLHVGANGTVTVPVNINDAHPQGSTGLTEAHLALTYDPRLFTVSAADVHLGSVLPGGGWSIVPTIDQATGQIGIALSISTPISSPLGGTLVTIDFHQVEAASGRAAFELVSSVSPNGQYIETELEDAQGTFTLTPAPANRFDPRIDGVLIVTPIKAAASVSTAAMEDTEAGALPVESTAQPDASLVTLPAAVSESSDLAIIVTTETTAMHLSTPDAHVVLVATSLASMNLGTPITGLAFQVGSAVVANAQTLAGLLPINPSLTSTLRDAIEHIMANPIQMPQSLILDSLNWYEAGNDLDGQMGGDLATVVSHPGWPDTTRFQTASPGLGVDSTALDQYFAQTADAWQQLSDDD